jgi:hypothetical protein
VSVIFWHLASGFWILAFGFWLSHSLTLSLAVCPSAAGYYVFASLQTRQLGVVWDVLQYVPPACPCVGPCVSMVLALNHFRDDSSIESLIESVRRGLVWPGLAPASRVESTRLCSAR